jgi:3'(2'), 5'-bisphosphate nucleotidase
VSNRDRLTTILESMIDVARAAGDLVLPLFEAGCASATKADGSIVTVADTRGEALITARLRETWPETAILGEEADAAGACPDLSGPYFCIDPIDGTKQFAAGDPHWVIAIAYVEEGRPLAGVILAPALSGRLFAGLADFGGFEESLAGVRTPFPMPVAAHSEIIWRVLRGGHDTPEAIAAHLPKGQKFEMTKVSSALKFGLIAAGQGDVFIRAGQVWDWDIAAGQAIIEAAGGRVLDLDGQPLVYGQAINRFRHPPFVVRRGGMTGQIS